MLREEALKSWQGLREKLKTILLTPQEKKLYLSLQKCRTNSFMTPLVKGSLDDLEKEINLEREYLSSGQFDCFKNEILMDYIFALQLHSNTILDWINLKRDYYKLFTIEEEE